jgi:hypothetical protein
VSRMTVPASLALSAWLVASPMRHPQPPMAQDTTPLAFLGIRAGVPLGELSVELRRRHGHLRCRRSKSDAMVRECRGILPDSVAGELAVWVSTIDSTAGVVTLSAPLSATALGLWQDDLSQRYGKVKAVAQGAQRMMQWVRRGRMLRLTWRAEKTGTTASVSLVDGRVLDRWGRKRNPGTENGR